MVSGSILVAAGTFFFTKRHEIKIEWQKQKLNHDKVLLSSLSSIAVDGTDKEEANKNQTPEEHDRLLQKLLLEIRKDIELSEKDDPNTFDFHLIGSKPKILKNL
jgi:hypothetical protein